MADAKRIIRPIISLLLVGVTALGLYNTFGDNGDVVLQAQRVACGDTKDCNARMTRMARNPIAQDFEFQLSAASSQTVAVDCSLSLVLLGDWQCKKQ